MHAWMQLLRGYNPSSTRSHWQLTLGLLFRNVIFVWVDISLDFIESFPKSKEKDFTLMVVDRFNRSGHFVAITHP